MLLLSFPDVVFQYFEQHKLPFIQLQCIGVKAEILEEDIKNPGHFKQEECIYLFNNLGELTLLTAISYMTS